MKVKLDEVGGENLKSENWIGGEYDSELSKTDEGSLEQAIALEVEVKRDILIDY